MPCSISQGVAGPLRVIGHDARSFHPGQVCDPISPYISLGRCVTAVRAVLTTFSDPYNAMDSRVYPDTTLMGAASIWPLAMASSVHLFHMLPPSPTISRPRAAARLPRGRPEPTPWEIAGGP